MNKIMVDTNNKVVETVVEDTLTITFDQGARMNYVISENLLNNINQIQINGLENCDIQICEKTKRASKITYQYSLEKNSRLNISRFNENHDVFEKNIVNLNGEGSSFNFNLSTICKQSQFYDIQVFHNAKNTTSNVINHGVSFENSHLEFQVSGTILKNSIKSNINQESRIILMGENSSTITPKLFIDEEDVEARHSAHLGSFDEEQLFYLQTRGMTIKQAERLLLSGFLKAGLDMEIKLDWR